MRRFGSPRRAAVVLACAAVGVIAGLSSASAAPAPAAPQAPGVPAGAAPVKSLWTRTSRTYRDGAKNVTVAYGDAVNYLDSSGFWQPIDDTLVRSSTPGYAFENRADEYKVKVPADLSAAPVELDHHGSSIGFQLEGAHGVGVAAGRTAHFAGALPHTDVAYSATSQGVHETLTLASPAAPQSFTYRLDLGPGVTAVQDGPRVVTLLDRHRAELAYFVAPSMTDAAGASSSSIGVSLSGDTVTVTPDAAWLAGPARQWPVTVDPDVLTLERANQDTYIESGSADTFFGGDSLLKVGFDGSQVVRGLLNFNPDNYLPTGITIDNAQLQLDLESETSTTPVPVTIYNATSPWRDATWNQFDWDYQTSQPLPWTTPGGDVDASVASTLPSVGGQTGALYIWDVTQLLQRELDGTLAPDGFVLEQQGENVNDVLGFASSYASDGSSPPTLTITWEPQSTTGPQANLIWTSIDFGAAAAGTTTATQEVDVTNTGSATLTFGAPTLGGAYPGDFSVVGNTCKSLAPNAQCAITLTARPQAVGNFSATLQIVDNAADSPQKVALYVSGEAGPPAPAVSFKPTSLDFGTVRVGAVSKAQTVTVANSGAASLTIKGVTRAGADPNDFLISSNTCKNGLVLAPGASCTVGVAAKPRAKGTRTATVRISDNAPDSPQSVPLSVVGS